MAWRFFVASGDRPTEAVVTLARSQALRPVVISPPDGGYLAARPPMRCEMSRAIDVSLSASRGTSRGGSCSCRVRNEAPGANVSPLPRRSPIPQTPQYWARVDSNHRRLTPTGLQPVSFGHSDTRPCFIENKQSGRRVQEGRGLQVESKSVSAGTGVRPVATPAVRKTRGSIWRFTIRRRARSEPATQVAGGPRASVRVPIARRRTVNRQMVLSK